MSFGRCQGQGADSILNKAVTFDEVGREIQVRHPQGVKEIRDSLWSIVLLPAYKSTRSTRWGRVMRRST